MHASRRPLLRAIARVVIAALVFNALSPLSVLAQEKGTVSPAAQRQLQQLAQLNQRVEKAKADKGRTPADRASDELAQAEDLVRSLEKDRAARAGGKGMRLADAQRNEHRTRLQEGLQAVRSGRANIRAEFDAVGAELKAKGVAAEVLARHDETVREVEQRAAEFERLSQAWAGSPTDANVQALDEFFKRHPAKRKAAPFDPKKLPWSTPKPTQRPPATTKTAWFQKRKRSTNRALAERAVS